MKKYIILTNEGQTIAPNSKIEINNLQVLGFVHNARNENDAIIKLLKDNAWIIEAEFNVAEFIVHELL